MDVYMNKNRKNNMEKRWEIFRRKKTEKKTYEKIYVQGKKKEKKSSWRREKKKECVCLFAFLRRQINFNILETISRHQSRSQPIIARGKIPRDDFFNTIFFPLLSHRSGLTFYVFQSSWCVGKKLLTQNSIPLKSSLPRLAAGYVVNSFFFFFISLFNFFFHWTHVIRLSPTGVTFCSRWKKKAKGGDKFFLH